MISLRARVHEAMNAVVWQAHPYRRPIIGWMSDLEQMTVARCSATGTAAGMRPTTPPWSLSVM